MENEMYSYDFKALKEYLSAVIQQLLSAEDYRWLLEKADVIGSESNAAQLNLSFAIISRKTGSKIVRQDDVQKKQLESFRSGFSIDEWPLHRLCRTWLLLNLNTRDKNNYRGKIETLFNNAEMNELADLHAALPVLAFEQGWIKRCEEGVRSNIGMVLEAIMYDNPYPFEFLDEAAWNQLVLKAFFTDKDVNRIIGLDKRANKTLASTLIDYAHERWAAHRHVNNQLWRLVGKFIDEHNFADIKKVFDSGDSNSKKAAALSLAQSEYEPAKKLLDAAPELAKEIEQGTLKWANVKP